MKPEGKTGSILQATLIAWLIYCIGSTVYVFDSGIPQPADYIVPIIVLVFLVLSIQSKQAPWQSEYTPPIVFFLFFVIYAWAISLWRLFELQNYSIAVYPVFYTFNFILVICVLILGTAYREKFLELTSLTLIAALLLQVLYMLCIDDYRPGLRAKGLFNNPNQFGYFALLSLTVVLCSWWCNAVSRRVMLAGAILCLVAIGMSLSKAAVLGLGVYAIWFIYKKPGLSFLFLIVLAIVVYLIRDTVFLHEIIRQFEYDLSEQGDSSFAARGYYRMLDYPGYLFLGAAEGAYERFSADREFHSSLGTILFCYGLPGTLLFLAMLASVIKRNVLPGLFFIAPALIYGLAHQGLRFSMLWVMFACVAIALQLKSNGTAGKQAGKEAQSIAYQ